MKELIQKIAYGLISKFEDLTEAEKKIISSQATNEEEFKTFALSLTNKVNNNDLEETSKEVLQAIKDKKANSKKAEKKELEKVDAKKTEKTEVDSEEKDVKGEDTLSTEEVNKFIEEGINKRFAEMKSSGDKMIDKKEAIFEETKEMIKEDCNKLLVSISKKDIKGIEKINLKYNQKDQTEGDNAEGGYIVPEELAREIIKPKSQKNAWNAVGDQRNIGRNRGNTILIPHLDLPEGGASVAVTTETDPAVPSSITFGQSKVTLKKYTGLNEGISSELLKDNFNGFNLLNYISSLYKNKLDNQIEDDFYTVISGDVAKSGALEIASWDGTLSVADAEKVGNTIQEQEQEGASIVCSYPFYRAVKTIKDTTNNYIQGNQILANGKLDVTLFGMRLYPSKAFPVIGTGTATIQAIVTNFDDYYLKMVQDGVEVEQEKVLKTDTYNMVIRRRIGLAFIQPEGSVNNRVKGIVSIKTGA